MKKLIILGIGIGIGMGLALTAQNTQPAVIYVDAEKVAQAIARTGLLANNAEFMVAGAHRDKPGEVNTERPSATQAISPSRTAFSTGRFSPIHFVKVLKPRNAFPLWETRRILSEPDAM